MAAPDTEMTGEGVPEGGLDGGLVAQLSALGVETTGVPPDLAAKLCRCASLKEEGNALFAAGKAGPAYYKYFELRALLTALEPKRALSSISGVGAAAAAGSASSGSELPQTAERLVRDLMLSAELNSAACMLKRERWERVEEHCTKALALDPRSGKALLRRAKSRRARGLLEEALIDLAQLNALEPGNADAVAERREVAKMQREVDVEAKKTFSKMFA